MASQTGPEQRMWIRLRIHFSVGKMDAEKVLCAGWIRGDESRLSMLEGTAYIPWILHLPCILSIYVWIFVPVWKDIIIKKNVISEVYG